MLITINAKIDFTVIKNPYSNGLLDMFLLKEKNLEPSQAPTTQPLSSQVQTQSMIECLIPGCSIICFCFCHFNFLRKGLAKKKSLLRLLF